MIVKTCVVRRTEKGNADFDKIYRECKQCDIERILKRYYDQKDGILQNVEMNMHVL